MANADIAANQARFEVRVTADSHFAWLRTRLSVERTMMSWVRTAVSLIGFGFAIEQFFQRLQQTPGTQLAYLPDAPKYLGVALICLRHPGAGDFDLAVQMDLSLPEQWTIRIGCRIERGECSRRSSRSLSS